MTNLEKLGLIESFNNLNEAIDMFKKLNGLDNIKLSDTRPEETILYKLNKSRQFLEAVINSNVSGMWLKCLI